MNKYIDIAVSTINGEILERPKVMSFRCDGLDAVGLMNVRQFDINDCIVVKKVFAFNYAMGVYGSLSFNSIETFLAYKNSQCACCSESSCCYVTYQGCIVTYNGKQIAYNGV